MTVETKTPVRTLTIKKLKFHRQISRTLGIINGLILFSALCVLMLDAFVPSLNFLGIQDRNQARALGEPQPVSMVSAQGHYFQARRVILQTQDKRALWVDYVLSSYTNDHLTPITVIVPDLTSGAIDPLNLLPDLSANTIAVVYTSPRAARMTGPLWPSLSRIVNAESFDDLWLALTTNPLTAAYALQMGLHEAPYDITALIDWAKENLNADIRRINLVGVGSGALVAAAAAERLQSLGLSPARLALVYPPADLKQSIEESLVNLPESLRSPAATALRFFLRRLELENHLPNLRQGQILVVIPKQAPELATYAAMPALFFIPPQMQKTIAAVDHDYRSMTNPAMMSATTDIIMRWMEDKK